MWYTVVGGCSCVGTGLNMIEQELVVDSDGGLNLPKPKLNTHPRMCESELTHSWVPQRPPGLISSSWMIGTSVSSTTIPLGAGTGPPTSRTTWPTPCAAWRSPPPRRSWATWGRWRGVEPRRRGRPSGARRSRRWRGRRSFGEGEGMKGEKSAARRERRTRGGNFTRSEDSLGVLDQRHLLGGNHIFARLPGSANCTGLSPGCLPPKIQAADPGGKRQGPRRKDGGS